MRPPFLFTRWTLRQQAESFRSKRPTISVLHNQNSRDFVQFYGEVDMIEKCLVPVLLTRHYGTQRRAGEHHVIVSQAFYKVGNLYEKAKIQTGKQQHVSLVVIVTNHMNVFQVGV